jgi:hypothetical protein
MFRRAAPNASKYFATFAAPAPMALAIATSAIAGQFYDVSWDGLAIHQRGVFELARGWNPILDEPLSLHRRGDNLFWNDHYPKGSWTLEASLYALMGRIEPAKGVNLLLMTAAGLLTFSALSALGLRRRLAIWTAGLLALNPVSLCQSLSFYLDGQVASALLSLLAMLVIRVRGASIPVSLPLIACAVYLSNLKFTGLAYALILGFGGVAAHAILQGCRAWATAGVLLLGILFGVVGPGLNPYLTNTLRAGHPFYPLMGPGRIDIMRGTPPAFARLTRLEKLARSNLSRSNGSLDVVPRLKVPFTVTRKELSAFAQPDTRVGGFGPWYGGALLLSTALFIGLLAHLRSKAALGLGAIAFVFLSSLANPEAWWARYAPQLWFPPLLLAAWSASSLGWLRRAGLATAVAPSVNVFLVAMPSLREQVRATTALRAQLAGLREAARGHPVATDLGGVHAVGVRLSEAGLAHERVDAMACEAPVVLDSYPEAKVCLGAQQ